MPIRKILSNTRGSFTVLIAAVLSTVIGILASVSILSARRAAQRNLDRVNRFEGFYTGEMLAWYADGNGVNGINHDPPFFGQSPHLTVYNSALYASWTELALLNPATGRVARLCQ